MRRLVEEVVLDDDERAVYDAVAGFGPLQRHLDDPDIEERSGSTSPDRCSSPAAST